MNKHIELLAAALAIASQGLSAATEGDFLPSACNVVWTTPSRSSSGSMPLGNGDIGLNVWVEGSGDLLFYIGKTDAFSENDQLLKLGRVRVKLTPNPFAAGAPFKQELRLWEGEVVIVAGERAQAAMLHVWVDANRPVIHVEAEGQTPFEVQATVELWRTERRELPKTEQSALYELSGSPDPLVIDPDTVLPAKNDQLVWFHRNERSCFPATFTNQHLESLLARYSDPLLRRTFGCSMKGPGLVAADNLTLKSARPALKHRVSICALTAQTDTVEAWAKQLGETVTRVEAIDIEAARGASPMVGSVLGSKLDLPDALPRGARRLVAHSDVPLRIGADSNGENRFVGRMARARIWSEALAAEQVAALAAGGSKKEVAKSPTLVADFAFDSSENGAFACRAGSGLVARPQGQVAVVDAPQGRVIELKGQGFLEVPNDPRLDLRRSCSLEVWAQPETTSGRLLDKTPAGTAQGYLLDHVSAQRGCAP